MSRKIGYLNDLRADDFGLAKGQDFVIFFSTSDSRFLASLHVTQAKISEGYQLKPGKCSDSRLPTLLK